MPQFNLDDDIFKELMRMNAIFIRSSEYAWNIFRRCPICGAKNLAEKEDRCRGACTPDEGGRDQP